MRALDPPFDVPHTVNTYELIAFIGQGAFSHVYKARDMRDHTIVAVKIIAKSHIRNSHDEKRLQREVNTMAFLKHNHIVSLIDFFEDPERFFLVIDFCEGGSVFDSLHRGVRFREPQAATIFRQVVDAVSFCHFRGVAHRDLKPQNILITTFPEVKVSDFGLCGYIDEREMMHSFCGSPCYAAPECLKHCEYDGRKADIWSLGVVLYEMVTCEHPWNVANTAQMLQQITKASYTVPAYVTSACTELIGEMLKVDPNERIAIDDILAHPWMKLAAKKISQSQSASRSSLPRLFFPTVREMGKDMPHDHMGVVSPFSALTTVPRPKILASIPRPRRMLAARVFRRGMIMK